MKKNEKTVTLKVFYKRLDTNEFLEEGDLPASEEECGPWYPYEEDGHNYSCKQCVAGHPPTAFPYTKCIQLD